MVYEMQLLYYQVEMISWLHKVPMFAACSWHLRILQLATSESETGGAGEARPGRAAGSRDRRGAAVAGGQLAITCIITSHKHH